MQKQTQPTHNTCVITCLAMLTGRDAMTDQELHDAHQRLWGKSPPTTRELLEQFGIPHINVPFGRSSLEMGKVYLLTVPSLNTKACFHQILVDTREGILILDPAEGTGKFYYTWNDPFDLGVPLVSWLVDFEVIPYE